jgi:hypothetical protein
MCVVTRADALTQTAVCLYCSLAHSPQCDKKVTYARCVYIFIRGASSSPLLLTLYLLSLNCRIESSAFNLAVCCGGALRAITRISVCLPAHYCQHRLNNHLYTLSFAGDDCLLRGKGIALREACGQSEQGRALHHLHLLPKRKLGCARERRIVEVGRYDDCAAKRF